MKKQVMNIVLGATIMFQTATSITFASSQNAFAGASSNALSSNDVFRREIIEAKPDALEFIQSDGATRTAKFEATIKDLRKMVQNIEKSDEQLALEIIEFQISE